MGRVSESLQPYNHMISAFIKSVEAHVIAGNYVVICKVRHSEKKNEPFVPWWIITNKEGTILSAHCRGRMAGLIECCSHVASILFYLETSNMIRGELSCTHMDNELLAIAEFLFAKITIINFKSAKKFKHDLNQKVDNLTPTRPTQPVQFNYKTCSIIS